jgi:hypothetical protein
MKTWVGDTIRDFTWRMMHVSDGLSRAVVDPYTLLNPFYMKSGVRPMWHMPCSIRCKESNKLAKEYLKFWPQEEKEWLKEIFSWPVEWSSLHGAAEIRTPVCKIITDTDPESTEHVIQFAGQRIPKEAATGNRFPYGPIEDTYSNNGFYTHEAMTQSHATILAATRDIKDIKNITDPGCGNGTLLNALSLMHKVNRLSGVDLNHHAIAQGRRLYPGINFTEGNLFNHYSSADMVVFMPGRLLENPTKTDRFVKGLNFRYLLLYGYSAYADRVDDLRKQYWPDCEIRSWVINDNAVAILLERP